jgi:hypothetical protein
VTTPIRTLATAAGLLVLVAGCQQKMAEQPYERPYEENALFPYNQSIRPLEKGTVHRNQPVDGDPINTWLTPEGRKVKQEVPPTGAASFDPKSVVPLPGAPNSVDNFVKELPFEMTRDDLLRGQVLYNANCALCHGAAGYGNGKIPERGFLRPPSYHTDPAGKEMDWSTLSPETGQPLYSTGLPAGHSRGFFRWGIKIPLKEVPVGYIYQVITLGFGGMGSHDVQLPNPADRWRVVAYLRTLQYSQAVPEGELPAAGKAALNNAGEKK